MKPASIDPARPRTPSSDNDDLRRMVRSTAAAIRGIDTAEIDLDDDCRPVRRRVRT